MFYLFPPISVGAPTKKLGASVEMIFVWHLPKYFFFIVNTKTRTQEYKQKIKHKYNGLNSIRPFLAMKLQFVMFLSNIVF